MKKHILSIILASCVSLLCLTGCGTAMVTTIDPFPAASRDEKEDTAFEEYDITLMAVGDNLIHMGIVHTGKQPDGALNYNFLFSGISDFLEKADIKIINQETILGGNTLGFSGYPRFNSPTEIGDAIADAGFNVVLHASNHAADKGITGLENCVGFWETHPEVIMAGIRAGDNAENGIPLLEVDGFTFAILNYTYGPNSSTIPSSIRGRLNMLCAFDEKSGQIDFTALNPQVIEDIRAAKKTADLVIVCPHWGTEYTFIPTGFQQSWAREMAEAGADLILGTHPHVIQPVEQITAAGGSRCLCYYSLGNYVSTQKSPRSMLEGMAWVTFHVTEDGIRIADEKTGVIPLVCHYTSGPVRLENVYLLENYTAQQAAAHGIRSYGGTALRLEDLNKWSDEVFGDQVLSAAQALGREVPNR